MKVVFRTDASLQIGSGHVMRCLTLADALASKGAQCEFICRVQPGCLHEVIRHRGYRINDLLALENKSTDAIKVESTKKKIPEHQVDHADWLGSDWQTDSAQTGEILRILRPDWLVVDHYALDARWETPLRPYCTKLMAIDDLADRTHDCDLLLDQNLGRQASDYDRLVPGSCQLMVGPSFAMLRPEFAALRPYSLQRRSHSRQLEQLIITMGGVDQTNATGQVMQALKHCALPSSCRITVVMGLTAPWIQNVKELAAQMPWPTEVVVHINDMAQRMADSDLAIGAAGSTSWERCCLGLPCLLLVLAANQQTSADALQQAAVVRVIDSTSLGASLCDHIRYVTDNGVRLAMSAAGSSLVEGTGALVLADFMFPPSSLPTNSQLETAAC